MIRGQKIFYKDNDLTVNTKKDIVTHSGIFLEELEGKVKIVNENGKLQLIDRSLVSH